MREYKITAEDIKEMVIKTSTYKYPIVGYTTNTRSHNVSYVVAVGAFEKEIRPKDFLEKDWRMDPKVRKLWENIKVYADPDLDETNGGIVEVMTNDGRKLVQRMDKLEQEVSTKEALEKKFMGLAKVAISESRARKIWNLVDELETVKDVRELGDLLRIE